MACLLATMVSTAGIAMASSDVIRHLPPRTPLVSMPWGGDDGLGDVAVLSMPLSHNLAVVADAAAPQRTQSGRPLPVIRLPGDIDAAMGDDRKSRFLSVVLPAIVAVNNAVLGERARLQAILRDQAAGIAPSPRDQQWLAQVARFYRGKASDLPDLLNRIDAIPTSLALGQAALESGWGTSRVAREGNALFGVMTWNNAVFEVKPYETIVESVIDYVRTLNSHPAYAEFRAERSLMRKVGAPMNGGLLLRHLTRYSELGGDYIERVTVVIEQNGFAGYDRMDLLAPWVPQG
ncbi:glucosaminidase domain-containing protein [Tistrella bauzanensis]|nr:glucosaminidase domain-containing protein [Tistrella bauzanensis]